MALLVDVEEGRPSRLALAEGRSWREVITAAAFSARHRHRGPSAPASARVIAFDGRLGDQVWTRVRASGRSARLTFAADRIVTTSADGRVWVAEGGAGTEVRSVPVEAQPRGASLARTAGR